MKKYPIVEFVGGPIDGEVRAVMRLQSFLDIPVLADTLTAPTAEPDAMLPMRRARYQLACDSSGAPFIDGQGRYRYRLIDCR